MANPDDFLAYLDNQPPRRKTPRRCFFPDLPSGLREKVVELLDRRYGNDETLLAEATGVSRSTIRRIVKGDRTRYRRATIHALQAAAASPPPVLEPPPKVTDEDIQAELTRLLTPRAQECYAEGWNDAMRATEAGLRRFAGGTIPAGFERIVDLLAQAETELSAIRRNFERFLVPSDEK